MSEMAQPNPTVGANEPQAFRLWMYHLLQVQSWESENFLLAELRTHTCPPCTSMHFSAGNLCLGAEKEWFPLLCLPQAWVDTGNSPINPLTMTSFSKGKV